MQSQGTFRYSFIKLINVSCFLISNLQGYRMARFVAALGHSSKLIRIVAVIIGFVQMCLVLAYSSMLP